LPLPFPDYAAVGLKYSEILIYGERLSLRFSSRQDVLHFENSQALRRRNAPV
jgi:hypothetical protein